MKDAESAGRRVSFYTLGCKVNQYETQMLKDSFARAGYIVVGEEEFADVYVINTCTVTNISDRKSRQYIRRMKNINNDAVIAVTGCYAQTSAAEVADIDGVCVVAGTNEKGSLVDFIEEYIKNNGSERSLTESHVISYDKINDYEETGFISSMDSRSRAYIKVQEGCDRFCSYCIIPYARGKVRSRKLESILDEAGLLVKNGCKEIVLTGINTALYGADMSCNNNEKSGIELLISELSKIEGDFRIRLSSLEPNVIDADIAGRLAGYDKLCRHIHLSLQSGSDTVLKRMNRRYNIKDYEKIAQKLRAVDKNYAITTDIIVGFPGETEREFGESIEAVVNIGFAGVHVFKYSRRTGTKAADMPHQVDGTVKNSRSRRLIEEVERVSQDFYRKNAGSVRKVLFEKADIENNIVEGYTDNYIRVFCYTENPEKYLDNFADVKLDSVCDEGMKGIIISLD